MNHLPQSFINEDASNQDPSQIEWNEEKKVMWLVQILSSHKIVQLLFA
jgi:hypothetical protein